MNHDYEFVAKTFKIKLFGKSFEAAEPTNAQSDKFFDQYEATKAEGKTITKVYQDFLVTLGLPQEELAKLPLRGLLDIFSLVTGSKKN